MKRQFKAAAPVAEQTDRSLHLPGESPYLLTAEAARFLKFDLRGDGTERPIAKAMHLFREWAVRNHIPELRRGRTLLYDRRVLAASLRLHAVQSRPRLVEKQGDA